MSVRLIHATANRPGAIAILQLIGDSSTILHQITGIEHWPLQRLRLVDLAGIDSGLVVRLNEHVTQLMPHGGPRVVQRLTAALLECGVELIAAPSAVDPQLLFPEASDDIEALTLLALADAQSPLAIDLLLDQPRRWRKAMCDGTALTNQDRQRSRRLMRLIHPPLVVLCGPPNVGKSTLSNALIGRSMSIAMDMPGTTRDYTAGRIDLGGLVVDWFDTPGLRETSDSIEQSAISLAQRLISRADLIVAMRDHSTTWPALPRQADLRVLNKSDLLDERQSPDWDMAISATLGSGIDQIVTAIRERLVSTQDLTNPGVWLFNERFLSEITSK